MGEEEGPHSHIGCTIDPNGYPPLEVVLDADDPKTSYVAPPLNEEEKNRAVES